MDSCVTFIFLMSMFTLGTANKVRLADGGSRCDGRVEVNRNNRWGTVCRYDWDMTDANVVCRELGCIEALSIPQFGPGKEEILMGYVRCRGSESSLNNCKFQSWYKNYCTTHDLDAGVICAGTKPRLTDGPHLCSGRLEVVHKNSWVSVCDADYKKDVKDVCRELDCGPPVEVLGAAAVGRSLSQMCSYANNVELKCSSHSDVRLVNGLDSCSGRVELQYQNGTEWGTVCDVSWNMRAASVLCAQLKCGSAVAVLGADWFGEGSGRIWADVFDCEGNETHLSQCHVASWSRAACSHKQDVGIICKGSSLASQEGLVRLSGGRECEGEVEVYFMQDWRRVLLDSWRVSEGSVVCRQLGCGSVLNFSSSQSSPEHSHMCVTGFNCSGSEAHLRNCSGAQAVNCSFREQLYITCSDVALRSIRLVGSGGQCAGRLEIFHNGLWGTVCDDLWDIEDAQVVCRQLQCGVALSAHVPAWFGPGTGPILLNEVQCEGTETSLWNCRFQPCEEDECSHKEDVGVVCSEFREIRLTEGCKGNLEVFYNGTWGNVCDNGVDKETASLICQELNCGRTGTENRAKARLETAPHWLDDLECRNHDSTMWHCPSSSWGQKCTDVAQITCSEKEQANNIVQRSHLKCSSSPNHRACTNHLPLRLAGTKGSCSGRLEVFHNAAWGTVCDDLWDIRDAQVVCRQLGCGPALSAKGSAAFGAGKGSIWLSRVKCRGNEIHLWDCPHSLKKQTHCSHSNDAGVICEDMYVPTTTTPTSTSTTTTTTTTVTQSEKSTASPQTYPPITPVSALVLGTVFFLVLVLLLVLFYQNRKLRRVLSKRRPKTLPDAIYEEIDRRYITRRTTISSQIGSVLSDAEHSGYEDVDEEVLSGRYEDVDEDLLSEKSITVVKAEYYDDVTTNDVTTGEDTAESYDDVITAGQMPDSAAVLEDIPDNYDDVITVDQSLDGMAENYDDAFTIERNPSIIEESPHVDVVDTPEKNYEGTAGQEEGDIKDYDDVEKKPQEERNHVTERPIFRKLRFNLFKLKN